MPQPLSPSPETTNERAAIERWLREISANSSIPAIDIDTMEMVAGDASPRKYYRVLACDKAQMNDQAKNCSEPLTNNRTSLIVMDCPADSSMRDFMMLAESMRNAGLHTPKIFEVDLKNGHMLLEDFGNQLVKAELSIDNGDTLFCQNILPVLKQLQDCETHALPRFDAEKLRAEMQLFVDWFCAEHRQEQLTDQDTRNWQLLTDMLIENASEQRQTFVHRDFHCCNVMRLDDRSIGVIDFQDAVLGPVSYDLASWIWDRYIDWPRNLIQQWIEKARLELAPDIEQALWQKQCDWMGLQRNLKIIGIFCRLSYRDGKQEYMQLLPQFAGYVIDTIKRYPELTSIGRTVTERIAYLTSK